MVGSPVGGVPGGAVGGGMLGSPVGGVPGGAVGGGMLGSPVGGIPGPAIKDLARSLMQFFFCFIKAKSPRAFICLHLCNSPGAISSAPNALAASLKHLFLSFINW